MSVTDLIVASGLEKKQHAAKAFPTWVLARVEELLPKNMLATAETGCGKSTILFSNLSQHHTVFSFDDTAHAESSVNYYRNCPVTKLDHIEEIFGSTQITLPKWNSQVMLDAVLIDGPHAFPFPELEYYYFYPRIKTGGILIIDDVQIPTLGRMADVIAEDEMFELVELAAFTAVFRRTEAPAFNPYGDGWHDQHYNRRHSGTIPFQYSGLAPLDDGKKHTPFAQRVQGGSAKFAKQFVKNNLRRQVKKLFSLK
jgi:predicted O-methyltransferase YrrM